MQLRQSTVRALTIALMIAMRGSAVEAASLANDSGAAPTPNGTVFVEAESFTEVGGWVVDQQFTLQMGSPFLLAHGLGVPVADAKTTIALPKPGAYRVLVRTRDWASPHAPGKFQVLVDGKPLAEIFGTKGGGEWIWQDGGVVEVAKPLITAALHDLTGFEGRCDAIVFVPARETYVPPAGGKPLAEVRHMALGLPDTPPPAGDFDLVVVGGGVAGCCTSVSAARAGLKVALIQDRPELGGNNSSEVRVHIVGLTDKGPYPHLNELVKQFAYHRGHLVEGEKNISLFLNTMAVKIAKTGPRIDSVVAIDVRTGKELRFRAPLFADCTGDGTIGYLAGADYREGRESRKETGESLAPLVADKRHMGSTQMWSARTQSEPAKFPACPWAIRITAENFPAVWKPAHKKAADDKPQLLSSGGWDWESGFARDTVNDAEYIRDYNFRAIYGTWDYLKNRSSDRARYANYRLKVVSYVAGKRESRRLLGDVILTQADIQKANSFPDGCIRTNWSIDLHDPTGPQTEAFPGEEFRSRVHGGGGGGTGLVPYRCLYSRNVPNLFMAGRDISVTHVALGPTRVQGTTGQMGAVVGQAAYLCKTFGCLPRDVYGKHLDELKGRLSHLLVSAGDRPGP